jgi:outer membrane lipoprotein-sorting protein
MGLPLRPAVKRARPTPSNTHVDPAVDSRGRPATIARMSASAWDRAAALPVPAGSSPRPEVAALGGELPTVEALFTFMRDAEMRFTTLRMRIEERSTTARGDEVVVSEITLEHPGKAKVLTSVPANGTANNYEVWLSDGEFVRTFAAGRRVGTRRPVRHRVRGLASDGLPGRARVYEPVTPLPMESMPDLFLHPAGYCQNVLATGACEITGTMDVAGREAIVLECSHPRTIERVGDRADFLIRIAVDRRDGVILRLEESIGGVVSRDATATSYAPNAVLPPGAFDFTFPSDTVYMY